MLRESGFVCILLAAFGPAAAWTQELPPAASVKTSFETHIAPLFEQKCVICHGAANQMNGLRLDRKQDAMHGGHSGPSIVPGDSANSLLVHMIAGYKVKAQMPPAGDPLSAEEIGLVRAWIDQGAEWPGTAAAELSSESSQPAVWSYQPRQKPEPPRVRNESWPKTEIDRFILARLEQEGIEPSGQAGELTLLRRVSLDITGLPPTPGQAERFLNDSSPGAYERLVDELLRSPHYGEKWAMHWLDQVRYADSDGYEKDDERPHAWRYRHWVIEALNRDQPFDQFTIEQIAGDLLPHPATDQLVATGFHRNTLRNREGGVNFDEFRFEETVDRVNTVGTVWLGMTVGCAQCHDHKYDPVTQKEYYQLLAFFDNIEEEFTPAPLPGEMGAYLRTHDEYLARREELLCEYGVPEMQPGWEEKVKWHGENPGHDTAWDVNWDTLAKMTDGGDKFIYIPARERTERQAEVVTDYFIRFYGQVAKKDEYKELGFADLRKKLIELKSSYPQLSLARTAIENPEPRKTHIHVRGQWDRRGVEVEPAVPAVLPQIGKPNPTRLDLARWLVSEDNPLTARVIVNRIWQEYFGKGLVATSDDFGVQGEQPTHPELLDWLAEDFVRSGWSLKALHRRIVTSAAYRQSSQSRPELDDRDPDNRLIARQRRLRLPAELIRDSALAASGLLYGKIGGPSVKPPQPEGVASLGYANGVDWTESKGPDRYRRGLYIHFQRTVPYPFLMTFDSSERIVTACSRERSNTPLQALNLLNDPVFFEAAQGLATRILLETPSEEFGERLEYGYQLAVGRPPSETERARLERYYRDHAKLLDLAPGAERHWYPASLDRLDRNTAAAWTGVSRLLLNLDEFITRE